MTRIIMSVAAALVFLSAGCGRSSKTPEAALLAIHADPVVYLHSPKLRAATLKACQSGTPSERMAHMQLDACMYAADVDMTPGHVLGTNPVVGATD